MDQTREQAITEIMQDTGLPRVDAEFIYALEIGEIEGDQIKLDTKNPPSDADEEDDEIG